jgi:hypothetical protein
MTGQASRLGLKDARYCSPVWTNAPLSNCGLSPKIPDRFGGADFPLLADCVEKLDRCRDADGVIHFSR